MRKNSFKRIFAALALSAVATTSVASISAFAEGTSVGPQADGSYVKDENGTLITYSADDIAGAATKPTMSASKITLTESEAKANPTVTVEVSVSGADKMYASTGVHLYYDQRLTMAIDDFGYPDVVYGDAAAKLDQKTAEPGKTEKGGLFVASGAKADFGRDGVLYSINFTLPEDVAAGEKYDLDLAYEAGDLFTNNADDLEGRLMEGYMFTQGLSDGYIEIVEDPTEPPTTTTTTAATTTTTAADTTTTTAKPGTTTTAKPTTTGKATTTTTGKKADSPKTGVAGVGVAAAGLVVAAGAAFVLRKKED